MAPRAGVLPVAHGPPSRYIRAGCRPQCAERSARQSAGRAKRQRKMRLCPHSGAWLLSQVAHQETTASKVLRHCAAHRVPHVPPQAQPAGSGSKQARHHSMCVHSGVKPEQRTWRPRRAALPLRDGLLLAADAAAATPPFLRAEGCREAPFWPPRPAGLGSNSVGANCSH